MALIDNLVAFWAMDGSSAATYGGFNGTDYGTPVYGNAYGKIGQGVRFVAANQQCITFPTTKQNRTCPLTVNFWVYPTAKVSGANYIMFNTRTDSGYGTDISFCYPTYGIHGDIGKQSSWITTSADSADSLTLNAWNMVTAVYKATGYQYYINGASVSEGFHAIDLTGMVFTSTARFIELASYHTQGNYFSGYMDLIGLWGCAWSDADVVAMFNGGAGMDFPFSSPSSFPLFFNPPLRASMQQGAGSLSG